MDEERVNNCLSHIQRAATKLETEIQFDVSLKSCIERLKYAATMLNPARNILGQRTLEIVEELEEVLFQFRLTSANPDIITVQVDSIRKELEKDKEQQ